MLDDRTRLLVLIGQFTMREKLPALEDTIRAALAAGVPAREILEIILQCAVYAGHLTVDLALEVFVRVAEEQGLLEGLRADQLPLEGRDAERSLEDERRFWHEDDQKDPRLQGLMARHGWLGLSTGLRLRPKHILNILAYLDALDPEFAHLWLKCCFQDMYSRGVVDDKTRLLCMVGDCIAVGETTQARAHMRGAMRAGATPREVMEVLLQSSANFGMPPMLQGLKVLVKIMAEEGRLEEIGNPVQYFSD